MAQILKQLMEIGCFQGQSLAGLGLAALPPVTAGGAAFRVVGSGQSRAKTLHCVRSPTSAPLTDRSCLAQHQKSHTAVCLVLQCCSFRQAASHSPGRPGGGLGVPCRCSVWCGGAAAPHSEGSVKRTVIIVCWLIAKPKW